MQKSEILQVIRTKITLPIPTPYYKFIGCSVVLHKVLYIRPNPQNTCRVFRKTMLEKDKYWPSWCVKINSKCIENGCDFIDFHLSERASAMPWCGLPTSN